MISKIINSLAIIITLLVFSAAPAVAATTNDKLFGACDTNSLTKKSPICQPNPTTNPVNDKIKVAADIVAIGTGVAAVIFIMLGGFTMITSNGNSEAVANARKRVIYAVIGLVIVALAWTAVAFVTDKFIK
jgi:hypothetical protein